MSVQPVPGPEPAPEPTLDEIAAAAAVLRATAQRRAAAAQAEVNAVLQRYQCELKVHQVFVDGVPQPAQVAVVAK